MSSISYPGDGTIIIRPAHGEADAYYLTRQRHHYYGFEYDSQETLPLDYFPIAEWTVPEDDKENAPKDTFGVIAEHTISPTQSVRIGGAVALLLDQETTINQLTQGSFNAKAVTAEQNGFLLLNVVDPAWRGLGIGSELLTRRLDWIKQTDAEMVFAYGWLREDTTEESRSLLKKQDFTPIEEISDLYETTNRTACPDCRIWPSDPQNCHCNGIIWGKDPSK